MAATPPLCVGSARDDAHARFTHALVRALPRSFPDSLKLHPPPTPIDMAAATAQHEAYVALLRRLVDVVVEVPADEACPDCVFIEDTLVARGPLLVLAQPGAPERRPEAGPVGEAVAQLLAQRQRGACGASGTGDASGPEPQLLKLQAPALLDGGDVLFDGSCLWVGLTARTNSEAVAQLRQLLAPLRVPVAGLPVTDPAGATLHLKSLVTAIAPHHILAADNAAGRALVAAAQADGELAGSWSEAGVQLRVTYVPDQLCANVLRIGGHVVMQRGFPRSEQVIRQLCAELGLQLHTLDMSETAKADGALTCCSVLLQLPA